MKRTKKCVKKIRPPVGTLKNPWYRLEKNKFFRFTANGIWMLPKEKLPFRAVIR